MHKIKQHQAPPEQMHVCKVQMQELKEYRNQNEKML
jgi:hypothetical protein